MRKQNVVSLGDLRYIQIECDTCRTKVVLDMKERSALAEKHDFFAPRECPGCRANYDSATINSIDQLRRAWVALSGARGVVSFVSEVEVSGAA